MKAWTLFASLVTLIFTCMSLPAQQAEIDAEVVEPLPAPPGVALTLESKGRKQFHLGEKIELKIGLTSSVPGRFVYVEAHNLRAGHAFQFRCDPEHSVIDRREEYVGTRSANAILYSGRCGIGSGFGGGYADCDSETPLTPTPLTFPITLNQEMQFKEAGRIPARSAMRKLRGHRAGWRKRGRSNLLLFQWNSTSSRIRTGQRAVPRSHSPFAAAGVQEK